jgi:transglutaminase-like putative cysteine protease
VKYRLRHLTRYRYRKPVVYARCALRLTPQMGPDQLVKDMQLDLAPRPKQISERTGPFGERVTFATIETPHRELTILAESLVTVSREPPPAALRGPAWEALRDEAFASTSLNPSSPANFLYPTAMTALHPAIIGFADESFTPGRPVLEAGFELAARIKNQFIYDSRSTEISTPAIQSFDARRGVCQDFAHIMISGLQGLGLPAAYVSGYIRTIPPPGVARLTGADATHAWVNLWCGDTIGWVGLDPTNALVVGSEHVILAVGRDYSDVAPTAGVLHGSGEQRVSVAVDMIPIDEAWPEGDDASESSHAQGQLNLQLGS